MIIIGWFNITNRKEHADGNMKTCNEGNHYRSRNVHEGRA